MDDKDWEKFKNLAIFHVYADDKERDEIFGAVGVLVLIVGVIGLIVWGISQLL